MSLSGLSKLIKFILDLFAQMIVESNCFILTGSVLSIVVHPALTYFDLQEPHSIESYFPVVVVDPFQQSHPFSVPGHVLSKK